MSARRKWEVPRADLAAQYRELKVEIDAALTHMLEHAELIHGPTLQRFEKAVAARMGVAHAVGTSSGTAALQLALLSLGVGPGGEVIVPAWTFAATAAAVVHCGATPVFVDVNEHDFCLDAGAVSECCSPRTQAIVAVHLFGRLAPMRSLAALGLPVVEDAAQAFDAVSEEGRAGAIGALGCFSFHPSKNLGLIGDGGMITTDDDDRAALIRALVNHGRGQNQEHLVPGFNHRLDAIQAAVGLVKLAHVDRWTARRRELAARYDAGLAGLDLVRPGLTPGHVFHQYAIMIEARDALATHLANHGIATAKFYGRVLYEEPAFSVYAPAQRCRVAEHLSRRTLCLPLYPELSDTQHEKVLACIHRFFGSHVQGGASR